LRLTCKSSCQSINKEPSFFAYAGKRLAFTNPGAGIYHQGIFTDLARYQALFAEAGGKALRGEASTVYLMADYAERAAAKIQHFVPDCKLVAVLRQPAERAYSAFTFLRMINVEQESSFERALAAENSPARTAWPADHCYRANGNYATLLAPYLARFPREQLRIYLYEDWLGQPEATLRDLFGWLGVSTELQPAMFERTLETKRIRSRQLQRVLRTHSPLRQFVHTILPARWRHYLFHALRRWNRAAVPPLAPQLWQALTDGYREEILRLQELLDRDLGHWLVPRRPTLR
jgi:hypothetical protein